MSNEGYRTSLLKKTQRSLMQTQSPSKATVRRWEIYTQRQLKQPSWKPSSCYWATVATDTNKLFSAGERKHVRGFVWMKQHWHSHWAAVFLTSSEWTLQSVMLRSALDINALLNLHTITRWVKFMHRTIW